MYAKVKRMKADVDNKPPKEYLHLQIRLKKMKVGSHIGDLSTYFYQVQPLLPHDRHHLRLV